MQTENNIYHAYTISHFVAGNIFVTQPETRRVACVATMFVNTIAVAVAVAVSGLESGFIFFHFFLFVFFAFVVAAETQSEFMQMIVRQCDDNMSHVT